MKWPFKKSKENIKANYEPFSFKNGAINVVYGVNGEIIGINKDPVSDMEPGEEVKPVAKLDLSSIPFTPSPNKYGRSGQNVKCIVLHHTGPGSFNGIVNWLCDKRAQASAHYVVGRNGELKQLVALSNASWNAGKSKWSFKDGDVVGLNKCSIGIEIQNVGILEKGNDGCFYYEFGRNLKKWNGAQPEFGKITYPDGTVLEGYFAPYTEKQIEKLKSLCAALVAEYPDIGPDEILTHYEIATPRGRKNDPFGLDVESIIRDIF